MSDKTRRVIELMRKLLIGREDMYSIETGNGWAVARDRDQHDLPLSDEALEQHFFTDRCIGTYFLSPENTVRFIAFDVDIRDGGKYYPIKGIPPWKHEELTWEHEFDLDSGGTANLEEAYRREDHPAHLWSKLVVAICVMELAQGCKAVMNLTPLVVVTGGGAHVLLPFGESIPAVDARTMGAEIVESIQLFDKKSAAFWMLAGYQPKEHPVEIEVFPKQNQVRDGGYGNLIRVPLGKHRATGVRTFFASPGKNPTRPWELDRADAIEVLEKSATRLGV